MDRSMYLLQVSCSSKLARDVASDLQRVFKAHQKTINVVWGFKIIAEPKFVFVLESSSSTEVDNIVSELTNDVTTQCTSLRTYESFTRFCGVEDVAESPRKITPGEHLFWLDFSVECRGNTVEGLLDIWKDEAYAIFSSRKQGVEMDLFKAVFERNVHCFIRAESSDQLDEISFQLPLMKRNGDQVYVKTKPIRFFDEYISELEDQKQCASL